MISKWLKKYLPSRQTITRDRWLSWIGGINNSNVWRFNRESIARGLAVGLFVAFLPLPLQTVIAICGALILRGNLPIAVAATWVSNPITFVPICILILKVGQFILHDQNSKIPLDELTTYLNWNYLTENFPYHFQTLGKPFLVGMPVVAILAGIIGYFLALMFCSVFNYSRK